MFFMASVLFFFVYFVETSQVISLLSFLLLFISFCYFFCWSFLVFFFFFELSLLPILFMIMVFGAQIEKVKSSYYVLFYVFLTGLPFYFFFFFFEDSGFSVYLGLSLSFEMTFFLFLVFLMKFPVFFFHCWLPKAHVEASTSASMLLAGLLLKFGTMGFLRLSGILVFWSFWFFFFVSFLGMVFCCFYCMFQSDVKALVAYSSVVHMSFVLLVLLSGSSLSKFSSWLMMLSHGFVSFVIFFLVGEVYHVLGSRLVYFFSGVFMLNLFYSFLFFFFFLLNCGFPFSLGFFSEVCGFLSGFFFWGGVIFFFLAYFFFSFYYCLLFSTSLYVGSSMLFLPSFSVYVCLPFLGFSFNFFLFMIWAYI